MRLVRWKWRMMGEAVSKVEVDEMEMENDWKRWWMNRRWRVTVDAAGMVQVGGGWGEVVAKAELEDLGETQCQWRRWRRWGESLAGG